MARLTGKVENELENNSFINNQGDKHHGDPNSLKLGCSHGEGMDDEGKCTICPPGSYSGKL